MSLADLIAKSGAVSDPEDMLDQMVEAASRPSLGSLIQRAKDAGHIAPAFEYGHPVVA